MQQIEPEQVQVDIVRVRLVAEGVGIESELDEMWSFVQKKANQRWLGWAIDHHSRKVLAYGFGNQGDAVFKKLQMLLEPFGIRKFYTDGWGAYERGLEAQQHQVGKANTQRIERKHLTLRTRIKRLARKTICFSKCEQMHDTVIGLYINRYEFGLQL
ncbi:IS1 family transposase [Leptolyngbya sp. GB1-A1]|uniref:IS1 family transposase n=1 Tax=Leptolyngbya sp. GB1-A1 TaxID=2933908 RepID=UPI003298B8D4